MADPVSAPLRFWEWLFLGIWGVAAALVGVIWKRNNEDRIAADAAIQRVEDAIASAATKEEVKALRLLLSDAVRHEEYDQNRQEMRMDMNTLHAKIETMSRDIHAQIASNQIAILNAIATLKQ